MRGIHPLDSLASYPPTKGSITEIAEIFDRETGLPELLDVAKLVEQYDREAEPGDELPLEAIDKARAALKKATSLTQS